MDAAVVIPSYNARDTIRDCLDSLRRQTRQPDEVVVVDSSCDSTPDIVREEYPEVRLIHREQQTLAWEGRNIGAERAGAELVAFMDTDCIAVPDWLEALVEAQQESGCVAVGGAIGGLEDENWVATLDRTQFSEFLPGAPRRAVERAPTASFIVRRDAYLEVGGCPALVFTEDFGLCRKLTDRYGPLRFEPKAIVKHLSSPRLRDLYRRQRQLGVGFVEARSYDPSLSGTFVLGRGWVACLLPVARAVRTLWRLARYDRHMLGVTLQHVPTFVRCMVEWLRGYRRECRARERRPEGCAARTAGGKATP